MLKKFCFTAGLVAIASMAAVPASAAPINPLNTRPVAINDPSPGLNGSGEPGMATLLGLLGFGAVNTATQQSAAGMWASASGDFGSTVPTLAFEFTSGAATQTLGIWFGTDTTSIYTYDLFNGAAHGTPLASVASVQFSGNTMKVSGDCGPEVNCGIVSDSRITSGAFGFYLRSGSSTWFTVDQLNGGGAARALAFQDGATNDWAIGFEDGTDADYQDAVLKVESLRAVPEPGSLMLLGSGLVGLARAARRRMARA